MFICIILSPDVNFASHLFSFIWFSLMMRNQIKIYMSFNMYICTGLVFQMLFFIMVPILIWICTICRRFLHKIKGQINSIWKLLTTAYALTSLNTSITLWEFNTLRVTKCVQICWCVKCVAWNVLKVRLFDAILERKHRQMLQNHTYTSVCVSPNDIQNIRHFESSQWLLTVSEL